jgi:hypothetical protein
MRCCTVTRAGARSFTSEGISTTLPMSISFPHLARPPSVTGLLFRVHGRGGGPGGSPASAPHVTTETQFFDSETVL